MAVTLVEHGMTPSAIAARMTYVGAPESPQAAVAAGLLGLGSVFVGSMEGVAKMLSENADIESMKRIPGLGHPIHKPVDPRTVRLFEIARETGFYGKVLQADGRDRQAEEAGRQRHRRDRRPRLRARHRLARVRGIGVMARAIGLVGHILEEAREPMALELWERTEEEASAHLQAEEMNLGRDNFPELREAVAALCKQFDSAYWQADRREARLPREVRRGADQGRLDVGADPRGVRRLGPLAHRGDGDHGGSDALGRQRRLLPRPDVQHEHAAAPRLCSAEKAIPAEDRHRRAAPAGDGRHRARRRHRHHQDQDRRREEGRPLRRQRPEGLDLAPAALRADDPAGAHHAARQGEEEIRGHVGLPRRHRRARASRSSRSATW